MAQVRISKIAQQALEWLVKMGIEVKPAIKSGEMYEFEYNDILMFLTLDTTDDELLLSAPIYLVGSSDAANKDIFEIALHMTKEELEDYIIEPVKSDLSYIARVYHRPENSAKLRRYQFIEMLDDLDKAYRTFMAAAMIVTATYQGWNYEDLELDKN